MRSAIVGIVAAAAVMFAAPRHARACGQGGYGGGFAAAILTAMAVGEVDTGLLLWDGGSLIAGHQSSRGYAVFEAIWTLPQFALGAYATAAELSRPYGDATAPAIYTAAMALMTAHAIWTIAAPETEDCPRIALGATYVPVGQLSKPGLGVVGRF